MPAASTALRIARGISRWGSLVSSPSAAAPSNPANERNASTDGGREPVQRCAAGQREDVADEVAWCPGASPPISLTKMTTIRMMMSVTEIASIESSARVVDLDVAVGEEPR